MARLLKTTGLQTYARSLQRREHLRSCTVSPSIGFEFEIPLAWSECVERGVFDEEDLYEYGPGEWNYDPASRWSDTDRRFTRDWLRERGFISHFECGGFEVGSPVHYNISQARSTARSLIQEMNGVWWLSPYNLHDDRDTLGCCGIHVHAGLHESMGRDPRDSKAATYAELAHLVLNRSSAREFLWRLSGRKEGKDYSEQAVSTGWDIPDRRGGLHYTGCVRSNGLANPTIEYRFFEGVADRLIPAIDFAHSFTRWLLKSTDIHEAMRLANHNRHANGYMVCMTLLRETIEKEKLNALVPYIGDYKKWLDKQPGYKDLKNEEALALI